jgi:hypothetical protein
MFGTERGWDKSPRPRVACVSEFFRLDEMPPGLG